MASPFHSVVTIRAVGSGEGASAEGTRPFIEVLDLDTKATDRIWQSQAPFLEAPVGTVLNEKSTTPHVSLDDLSILITRETSRDPPQFHVKRFTDVRPCPHTSVAASAMFDGQPAMMAYRPVKERMACNAWSMHRPWRGAHSRGAAAALT